MDRATLLDALTLTSEALAKHDLVPIYKCFAFNGKTVTAYDGTIGVIAPCPIGEECVIPGTILLGLLENSKAEDIALTLDAEDITIKTGRSTFKLPFFPLEDYPFEDADTTGAVQLPINEDLIIGLQACLLTASRDTSKQALMGVAVAHGNLYSSDGDTISEYSLGAKLKTKEAFMMPNAFCDALLKVAGLLFTDEEPMTGTLFLNKDWVQAEIEGGYIVYGRMVENDTPVDFAKELKATIKGEELDFQPTPAGFDEALSRARVVSDRETVKTTLTIEKGRLKLLTESRMGVIRDSLAFPKHEDVVAHVSAALTQRSLGLCTEIVVLDEYCAFRSEKLFVLTGNME